MKTLTKLLLAGTLALSSMGCSSNKKGFYADAGINAGIDLGIMNVKLPKKLRTIPYHPEDSSETGETIVSNGQGFLIRPFVGADASVSLEKLRVKAGANILLPLGGFQGKEKQKVGGDSYAVCEVSQGITIKPIAAVEYNFSKENIVGLEFSMPHTEFRGKTQWYRWDDYETYQSFSWSGYGKGMAIYYKMQNSEGLSFSVSAGVEDYNPEFNGEKSRITIFPIKVSVTKRF